MSGPLQAAGEERPRPPADAVDADAATTSHNVSVSSVSSVTQVHGDPFPSETTPVLPRDAVDAVDVDTARGPNSVNVSSVGSVNGSDELVHAYTRAEAIADGVLVDVSRQASPAEMRGGFTVPVAVTQALWAAIEAIPASLAGIADSRSRLHDVLWMAGLAVRRAYVASVATSQLVPLLVHLPYRGTRKRTQRLAVSIGPDDDGRPCVTIGFPEDF